MTDWDLMALVGRIARPHGLRGAVVVNPESDFIEERFRPGAMLWTQSHGQTEALTIVAARVQNGRPIVTFDGLSSIDEVERLVGVELRVPEDALHPLAPGQYYHHQLVGCAVELESGAAVGVVARVEGGAGGARLIVEGARGEIQVPLATEICVAVDVAAKRIRIAPPEGLLELNAR